MKCINGRDSISATSALRFGLLLLLFTLTQISCHELDSPGDFSESDQNLDAGDLDTGDFDVGDARDARVRLGAPSHLPHLGSQVPCVDLGFGEPCDPCALGDSDCTTKLHICDEGGKCVDEEEHFSNKNSSAPRVGPRAIDPFSREGRLAARERLFDTREGVIQGTQSIPNLSLDLDADGQAQETMFFSTVCTLDSDCADDGDQCTDSVCGTDGFCASVNNNTCCVECSPFRGSVDTRFAGTNGTVYALAEDVDHIYLGGEFTTVGRKLPYFAALEPASNTLDAQFARIDVSTALTTSAATVTDIVADGEGGYFVAGVFESVEGQERTSIARLNTQGTLDTSWNPVFSNTLDPGNGVNIHTLLVHEGRLYVGGYFTHVDGQPASNLAIFDMVTGGLVSWRPTFDGTVRSLATHGSTLYVGGDFATVTGQPRMSLAALNMDLQSLLPWNPNVVFAPNPAERQVRALHVAGGFLYVGGQFDNIAGQPRRSLASFDAIGGALTAWSPDPATVTLPTHPTVNAFASSATMLYVGGNFEMIAGEPSNFIASFQLSDQILKSFNPGVNAAVEALALAQDGTLYVGGHFTKANYTTLSGVEQPGSTERRRLAAFDTLTEQWTSWNQGFDASVRSLLVAGERLLVGGTFSLYDPAARTNLAAMRKSDGTVTEWNPVPNQPVHHLESNGSSVLYAAGPFTSITHESTTHARTRMAAFSLPIGSLTTFAPAPNGIVNDLHVAFGELFVVGEFTSISGVTRGRIASYIVSTGEITAFAPNLAKAPWTVGVSSNRIYLGGPRGILSSWLTTRHCLLAYSRSAYDIMAWNPGCTGIGVNSLQVVGDILYAGGEFTATGGGTRNNLAAFDLIADNNPLIAWNPGTDAPVHAMGSEGNNLFVGGVFKQIAGQARNAFAAFETSTGTLSGWAPTPDGAATPPVRDILATGGKVYVGGAFESFDKVAPPSFAVLTPTGCACPALCTTSSECFDGDRCTDDVCGPDGRCTFPDNGTCTGCRSDGDCDDGDRCTENTCRTDGTCQTVELCCANAADCTPNPCMTVECRCQLIQIGDCIGGTCRYTDNGMCECTRDADCDDGNPCTYGLCNGDGTCSHLLSGACPPYDACKDKQAGDVCDPCDPNDSTCPTPTKTHYCTDGLECSPFCINDAECDDGDACTTNVCETGTNACVARATCEGTDTSCGCATCTNCDALDGWYDVGAPYACCDGGSACSTCQDQELRNYSCSGTECTFTLTGTQTLKSGCALCDDANTCTADVCVDGACTATAYCAGTDASCGCETCTDCNALDGWYDVGAPYACCDGGSACATCQDQELRNYSCSGTECTFTLTGTQTLKSDCALCNGADTCTADACVDGACTATAYCAGTDASCGCETCTDCDALDGWYDVGAPYACCDGGSACSTCQDQELRNYSCTGTECTFTLTGTQTLKSDCALCNDADTCTADSCVAGACVGTPYCDGTSTSCGCETCTNCDASDGWYDVGAPYACCDGGSSCATCQDQELRDYICSGTECTFTIANTQTLKSDCALCDDANTCTDNTCFEGICSYPPNGTCECLSDTDCTSADGWYDVGTPYACCDGGNGCSNCQDQEYRSYFCDAASTCGYNVTANSRAVSGCASCDDANTCTANSCEAGVCGATPYCEGTDGSCGCETCTDCTVLDGWYDVGVAYVCCDGGSACSTCQDQELRNYTCSGTECTYAVADVQTLTADCAPCDDGNACTSDACFSGTCFVDAYCEGRDWSCGCETCTDCNALDGWYDVGTAYACCDGGSACATCQDQEYRDYACGGTECTFTTVDAQTLRADCTVCDDGDTCTDNVCDAGACSYPINGSCGCASDAECNDGDLCTNNICGETWLSAAVPAPPARRNHTMVYDSVRNRVVLFGGGDGSGTFGMDSIGDTWEWDGVAWSQVAIAGPPPRQLATMAFDAARGRVVLFGGIVGTLPANDTWEWDGTTWTEIIPAGARPPLRWRAAMTYDATRNRVLLFGGGDEMGYLDDTWEWDGANWTQIVTAGPSARIFASMTYDDLRGRAVLFGGTDTSGRLSDTWEWDGASWAQISTTGPSARTQSSMTFDKGSGRTVLFGGEDATGRQADTWTWDGTTWSEHVTRVPSNRSGHAIVFDAARDEVLLFGGFDGTYAQDTWRWFGELAACQAIDNGTCECRVNTDCPDDGNTCTVAFCNIDNQCVTGWTGICDCIADADCNDGDSCTTGTCNGDGSCSFPDNGTCTCSFDIDCDDGDTCTDNTCGVDNTCSTAWNGSCICILDADCEDGDACTDNVCNGDGTCSNPLKAICDGPCADVTCVGVEVCYEGTCFPSCTASDQCDPDHFCYEGRCAPDACAGVTCADGNICYGGTCFPQCTLDEQCDPGSICYDGRCTLDACYQVQCPVGHLCYGGTCFPACGTDAECDPDHFCYNGYCTNDACAGVDCTGTDVCWGGTCFPSCTDDAQCEPDNFCYDGRCATEACADVYCPAGTLCYAGTCFQICTDDDQCDPTQLCYEGRCSDEACLGIQCKSVEACYGGSCFAVCAETVECTENALDACLDSRCAEDYCDDVQCGTSQTCFEGTCFQVCDTTIDCEPNHECYSGRCMEDPCTSVRCEAEQACYQGSCFQICDEDIDCEPNHYCYSGRCATEACQDVTCPVGQDCYMGSCFVGCTADVDCTEVDQYCFNQRCAPDPCAGVECRADQVCIEGSCFASCETDAECDPDHHCYQGYCHQESCLEPLEVQCHPGQICYRGTCFIECDDDSFCDENSFCYDGRCATDSCAAMIEGYDDGESPHIYRTSGNHWPTIAQRSTPWRRPRPLLYSGTWDSSVSAALAGSIPARGKARVVLYLDTDLNRYGLVLLHGALDASQGQAGATYSMRSFGLSVKPQVRRTMGTDVTHVFTEDDFFHHQIQIESEGGTSEGVGAVALGYFPAGSPWTLRISASFRGDIDGWEFYSAETDEWLEIDLREELELNNVPIPSNVILSEEVGVRECVPTHVDGSPFEGICGRGTVVSCRYGSLSCQQTVSPWTFETCDGRDTTCDGQVDNVDPTYDLRVPMIFVRQEGTLNEWTRWPTVDASTAAFDALNYAPHGTAFGEGSVNIEGLSPTGEIIAIQQGNTSLALFHRDLRTGIVSMPMAHGARVTGSFPEAAAVEFQLEFDNDAASPVYDYSDLLFSAWHDDWIPLTSTGAPIVDSYGDEVPATMKYDEVKMRWDLRRIDVDASPGREADSGILQFVWHNGGTLKPLRFDIDANLPGSLDQWRLYRPYTAHRVLDPGKPLQIKLEWVPIEESICMSDTLFDGCRAVPYICEAGQLVCPAASDETCRGCRDRDGDGYLGYNATYCPEGNDCNDDPGDPRAPFINPGASETCDGRDTNCDGFVDAIGPAALHESCPGGQELCGPAQCNYRMICSCPTGDASCICMTTMSEDEEIEYTSGTPASWQTLPVDADEGEEAPATGGQDEASETRACSATPSQSLPPTSLALWLMVLAGLGALVRISGPRREPS